MTDRRAPTAVPLIRRRPGCAGPAERVGTGEGAGVGGGARWRAAGPGPGWRSRPRARVVSLPAGRRTVSCWASEVSSSVSRRSRSRCPPGRSIRRTSRWGTVLPVQALGEVGAGDGREAGGEPRGVLDGRCEPDVEGPLVRDGVPAGEERPGPGAGEHVAGEVGASPPSSPPAPIAEGSRRCARGGRPAGRSPRRFRVRRGGAPPARPVGPPGTAVRAWSGRRTRRPWSSRGTAGDCAPGRRGRARRRARAGSAARAPTGFRARSRAARAGPPDRAGGATAGECRGNSPPQ